MSIVKNILISYEELSVQELEDLERDDLKLAIENRQRAIAPVTGYQVGAVLRMGNGKLAEGFNIENQMQKAIHAEESAMIRVGKMDALSGLERVTIVGGFEIGDSSEIVTPCGFCRQRLFELALHDPKVIACHCETLMILASTNLKILKVALKDLLLMPFVPTINR